MTKRSDKLSDSSITQLFVYGLDEAGKPKGARFPASDTEKVLTVATAMKLQSSQVCSDVVANLGMKLPVGRIYARGKAFIPHIKRDLYDKLLAAIGSSPAAHDHLQVEGTAASSATTRSGGVAHASTETGAILPPLASGLPQNWESIASGNMILVDAGPGEGWWEAIVISRDNAILALRYRDYPKVPKFERHVSTVALINPRPA
jgi:hypothetical protein